MKENSSGEDSKLPVAHISKVEKIFIGYYNRSADKFEQHIIKHKRIFSAVYCSCIHRLYLMLWSCFPLAHMVILLYHRISFAL